MKDLFSHLYLWGTNFLANLRPIKEKNIVILNDSGGSGSNGYLFCRNIKTNHPDYNTTLVEPWPSSHLSQETWRKIGAAKYVITTRQPFKARRDQINIQFWYGVPLKRVDFMAHNIRYRDNKCNQELWHKNAGMVTSGSDLYESLMSAYMAIEGKKHQELGFSRVDYISHPTISKEELLVDLFKTRDDQAHTGIYMPTFRYELEDPLVMEQVRKYNYLASRDFGPYELDDALKAKHRYLIVKLHPYEMRMFEDFNSQFSNITFLDSDYLFKNNLGLYELLGNTDFLITGFSSIYSDYLYLDKPIIFITNYLKQYEKVRGSLLGPCENVTPGPYVNSQRELLQVLRHPDDHQYKEQHFYWRKLIDKVDNLNSCEPIFSYMTKKFQRKK